MWSFLEFLAVYVYMMKDRATPETMEMSMSLIEADIVIVGAGISGLATALGLYRYTIPILFDKLLDETYGIWIGGI